MCIMRFLLFAFISLVSFHVTLSAQDSARTQTVRGVVTDAVSGSPLKGATVSILDSGKVLRGAISDSKGAFRCTNVSVGRRQVKVTYIGYEPFTADEVLVSAGKEVVLNISLREAYASLKAVDVEYTRITDATITNNEFAVVSARPFNTEDAKRYAGSLNDPSRMAANFAGVVGANDSRNDIVVRGNSPAGMLWQMEGMNIPNPNHFGSLGSTGGPVSMLNNNVMEKSDFITSAFPAMYGNGLSGVFDLRLRDGNTEQYEYIAQMGFNGIEAGVEGPMWEGASFLVNYRYSTLALFNTLGIDLGTGGSTPVYQDLTFKIQTPVGENDKLTLFGVGGSSSVDFLAKDADTAAKNFYTSDSRNTRVKYRTAWTGLSYEHRFDANTVIKGTLGANITDESFQGDSVDRSTFEEFRDGEATFQTQTIAGVVNLRHKFSTTTNMIVGAYVDAQKYDLYNAGDLYTQNPRTYVDITDNATLTQGYGILQHRLFDWLSTDLGLHVQHFTIGDALAVEPRVGLSAMITQDLSINAGYGLHSQRQGVYQYNVETQTPTGVEYTNRDLGFTRSHHAVLGLDWYLTDAIRIKAESYYQSLFDVPVTTYPSSYSALNSGNDFAPDAQDSLVNNGTGKNYGAELTVEHFFRDGVYFLITGSLFNSQYTGSDDVERNTAFNTTYAVNVLGGKEFRVSDHNVFAANIRFSTTGGRFLTPVDEEASEAQGSTVLDWDNAYSERQTAYLRLDLKFSYRIEFEHSSLEFALDLQNVTNNQNVFAQQYDASTGQVTTQYQQGFFPVPLIRYTF